MSASWASSAVLAAALLVALPAAAQDRNEACADSTLLVGECRTVRGRLTACNGVPNARIWIVGTQRIVGVVDAAGKPAGGQLLPGRLGEEMFNATPCSKAAFGDYTVCPITPSRPGVMQRVCVSAASRVTVRDFD